MSGAPAWTAFSERFWCDETVNLMVALSDRYVAAQGYASVFVWAREDGALVRRFARFERWAGAWFDDGLARLSLRSSRGAVLDCDLATGAVRERAPGAGDPPHAEVSHDRAAGAVTVRWPGGATITVRRPGELIKYASCSVDPPHAAVVRVFATDVYDATGAVLRTFEGCGDAALAPDGRSIALCDWRGARVLLGDVAAGDEGARDEPFAAVTSLRWSPAGDALLVVAGGEAWVLDARDRSVRLRLRGRLTCVEWTPDGASLVGGDGGAFVRWCARTGAERARVDPPRRRAEIERLSLDARGERAAMATALYPGGLMLVPPDEVVVRDVRDGAVIARVAIDGDASPDARVELSPDGARLAIVDDAVARLVTLSATGAAPELVDAASWAGFRPEGVRAEASDGGVTLRRVVAGREVARLTIAGAVAADCDARGLRAAVARDREITLYDGALRALERFEAPRAVAELALSRDGRRVAAASHGPVVMGFDARR